jgi:hypothetical protein
MKTLKLSLFSLCVLASIHIKAQLKVVALNGNVGIGQNAPAHKLHINGNTFIEGINKLYIFNTNRYLGIPGGTNTGDLLLTNKDAGTWMRIGSVGGLAFFGNQSGEGPSNPSNMFLNGFGLGVGYNAQAYSGVTLYVAGNALITGNLTVYSDKRFKKNIQPIEESLSKLLKLEPKTYEYNKEEFKDFNFPDGKTNGLIAQEVMAVFPELVSPSDKGYYSINYIGLIPILIDGIKEQNKKISELETELSYCCKSNNQSEILKSSNSNNSSFLSNNGASLSQNNPNPFNKETSISYFLPLETKSASILIFDMQGKLIKTIPISSFGNSSVTLSANELNPGMFIYSLIADGKEIDNKRMILTK